MITIIIIINLIGYSIFIKMIVKTNWINRQKESKIEIGDISIKLPLTNKLIIISLKIKLYIYIYIYIFIDIIWDKINLIFKIKKIL